MLTTVCSKIIDAMARTLHLLAYADAVENGTLRGRKPGPGGDWDDVAPKTRREARDFACYLAGQITQMNKKSLLFLVRDAMTADAAQYHRTSKSPGADIVYAGLIENLKNETEYQDKYLERFGHCLVMESLGHGVGWSDDHADFNHKVPHVEFYY